MNTTWRSSPTSTRWLPAVHYTLGITNTGYSGPISAMPYLNTLGFHGTLIFHPRTSSWKWTWAEMNPSHLLLIAVFPGSFTDAFHFGPGWHHYLYILLLHWTVTKADPWGNTFGHEPVKSQVKMLIYTTMISHAMNFRDDHEPREKSWVQPIWVCKVSPYGFQCLIYLSYSLLFGQMFAIDNFLPYRSLFFQIIKHSYLEVSTPPWIACKPYVLLIDYGKLHPRFWWRTTTPFWTAIPPTIDFDQKTHNFGTKTTWRTWCPKQLPIYSDSIGSRTWPLQLGPRHDSWTTFSLPGMAMAPPIGLHTTTSKSTWRWIQPIPSVPQNPILQSHILLVPDMARSPTSWWPLRRQPGFLALQLWSMEP